MTQTEKSLEQLREFGANLKIPEPSDDEGLILTPTVLPKAPVKIAAPDLVVELRHHDYDGSYPIPSVYLHAPKEVLRGLGLLLFSQALGKPSEPTHISVSTDQGIGVKELRIALDGPRHVSELYPGATLLTAEAFEYWPAQDVLEPFDVCDVNTLPFVMVGDENRCRDRPEKNSILHGFGSLLGTILLAEFLLNVSAKEATGMDYSLECEMGVRGVAPGSMELRFFLPGSPGWNGLNHV